MSNPGSLFWDLGIYVLIGFVLLSIASGWLRMFMDGYRRGRDPQRYRRIAAQVVDVQYVDSIKDDEPATQYRVLLRFTQEDGELVVVDTVCDLGDREKDLLLPDRWLMIEYLKEDPQQFRIDFAAGWQGEGAAAAAPASATVAETPSLYGPPR